MSRSRFRVTLGFTFMVGTALNAGCGGASSNTNDGLYINAALGVRLIQSPITTGMTPEGNLSATVSVARQNGQGAQIAAILTVNGVEVPKQETLGVFLGYDFSKVSVPNATAGGTLTLHASFETYSGELTLHCPSEVIITAPADNSQSAVGDSVTVSWNGALGHATPIRPDIMVRGFKPASGSTTGLVFADRIVTGKARDTFALPDLQGAPEWLVDLYVPGDLVNDEAGFGFCMLDRRIHIVSK